MAGKKYTDGIIIGKDGYSLFNLDSRYAEIECTVGHVQGKDNINCSVDFIVDDKLIKTVELEANCLPKTVSIPLTYGLQLKIKARDLSYYSKAGIGNITVK